VIGPFFEKILDEAKGMVHSLYVVGTAVTEEYRPERSDINSIIVLAELDIETVARLGRLGRRFAKRRVALPFLLAERDIRRSTDVFPIEFLNLCLLHHCAYGSNILEGLEIGKRNLRLQCERELKSKLVWLLRALFASEGKASLLRSSLSNALKDFVPLFRAIIFLFGESPPKKKEHVIERLSCLTGLDASAFLRVLSIEEKREGISLAGISRVIEDLYETTRRLTDVLDGLSV